MKKLIAYLLTACALAAQVPNVNVQKSPSTNALTNSFIVGSGTSVTPNGTGIIIATNVSGNVSWNQITNTPNSAAGYGIVNGATIDQLGASPQTGTGAIVFSNNATLNSATMVTPNLGTPSYVSLNNGSNLPTTALTGKITNSQLTNNSITVTAGTGLSGGGNVQLGGTVTLTNNYNGTVTQVGGTGNVNGITLTGNVTTTGNLTLGGTLGNITNSQLTNNSINVIAGNGLSGGGNTQLGSSVTLSNAGVTNISTGTGISANASTGSITLSNTGVTSIVAGTNVTINSATGSVQINSSNPGGTVTSVSTNNQNGVITSVATATSTPNITIGLGNITPLSDTSVFNGPIGQTTPNAGAFNSLKTTALTGYLYGNGASNVSAATTIPTTALSGTIPATSVTGLATVATTGNYYDLTNKPTLNAGTVTSVSGTGTVQGITLTGNVTNSGSLTLGGSLSAINLASQVTGTLPVASGGTGVTTSSGANSVVLRDSNSNVSANNFYSGFSNQAASGTTLTLTALSAPNIVITGSGGQTIKLPDATTLANGTKFSFNNNQSSGAITVQNNSSTTICTTQSGAFIEVVLLSNGSAAGTWDYHNVAPSNASWSTNTLSWAGSYTNGTWNGNAIGALYGGTGTTGLTGYVYGNGTSAMTASTTIPTSALTSNSITITAGTGLSGGGTVALGGTTTLSNAGVTSVIAGTGVTVNSSTGSVTINATGTGGTVTNLSVTGNSGVLAGVATPTTTPAISIGLGNITPTSVTTGNVTGTIGNFTQADTGVPNMTLAATAASNTNLLYLNQPNSGGANVIGYSLLKLNNQGNNPSVYISNNGSNPFLINSAGNVGIGTSSPISLVNVENGYFSTGSSTNTTQTNILLQAYGYKLGSNLFGNVSIRSSYNSATNVGDLEFYIGTGATNTSKAMTLDSSGNLLLGTTSAVATGLTVGQTTASTSTTTGAIVDAGGIGVTGNAYVGGQLNVTNNTFGSYAFNQGSIVDAGGLGVQGNIYAGGNNNNTINVARNNGATNPSSIGMSAFNYVPYISYTYSGGTLTNGGNFNIQDATDGTVPFFIYGNSLASTTVGVQATLASSSTSTGAFTVAGGIGVAKNSYFGGTIYDTNTGLGLNLSPSAFSQSAWGTAGVLSQENGTTVTDSSTAASGTAASEVFHSFGASTLAATNTSVTTTDAANVYIAGGVTAGTNQTITNNYGLWNAGNTRIDGNLYFGSPISSGGYFNPTLTNHSLTWIGDGNATGNFIIVRPNANVNTGFTLLTYGTVSSFYGSGGVAKISNASYDAIQFSSIQTTLNPNGSNFTTPYLSSVNGSVLDSKTYTLTDSGTAASGTLVNQTNYYFAPITLAATNTGVTTTDAATVRIGGNPTVGTNETITNSWGLLNQGNTRLDGNVKINSSTASTSTTTGSIVTAGGVGIGGNAYVGGVVVMAHYTVATLPTASSYTYGECFVSDATQAAGTSIGSSPTGGGSVKRKVYSDGTNWLLE